MLSQLSLHGFGGGCEMDGQDARALRRRAGMSQEAFAEAIGLSRETVGRLERGSEEIDRRTELAMRFVVEKGPLATNALRHIHQNVANILDEAAIKGRVSAGFHDKLRNAASEWIAADGSEVCMALIRRAQAVVGWLNTMSESDPSRTQTYAELRQIKLAWRAIEEAL